MRLRTWLILGYSAVLALATVGLGLGLATVVGLAATGDVMVDANFRALVTASELRRLAATPGVPFDAAHEQALATHLGAARAWVGRDPEVDDAAAVARAEQAHAALLAALARSPAERAEAVHAARAALHGAALEYYALHERALGERGQRIRRQSDRLALALVLLGGFTVLVGVLASLRLAERLRMPMERLSEAAAQVASGNFAVRIGRTGLQEADLLAQRFDDMTVSLGRFHARHVDRILAESRRLDQVVASIDEGLLIFDERGRVERCNPPAREWLGLGVDAIGRRAEELALPSELGAALARAATQEGPAARDGGTLTLGEGEAQRHLSWSLLPFAVQARRGLILALRDITAMRQFERMRTDFVLRASHELRTPITGMRMAFGLLEDKLQFAPDTREGELVATLRDETQRLVNLINALLDLSRLYAGSYPLRRSEIDLGDVLQRARQRYTALAEHEGLSLELDPPPALPALADGDALDRVLDNLIGNAIRHTPRGGRVTLGGAKVEDGVEFFVRDTGEGIAHADRARVFEPFVQVGGRVGGVGLGLALCREILRQHGGRLRLDSAPGRGSCFTAWLPG